MASRLTVLYGPSGVGKTSLLRAGVVPTLRAMPETAFSYLAVGRSVVLYQAEWSNDPLASLGDALRDAVQRSLMSHEWSPPEGPLSVDMLREVQESVDADVYLIFDQFEEASLYVPAEAAEAFGFELGRIVATPGLRVSVLIGVREDALAKLDRLEVHVPGLFANNLRLDHLNAEAARDAIEEPLKRFNLHVGEGARMSVEPGLVTALLMQLRTGRLSVGDSGQGTSDGQAMTVETPYLQLVMTRLWAEESALGSRILREATLHDLGDSERIVRTHLDSVMSRLSESQRQTAAAVFRFLVTPSGMKIAHRAEDLAAYADLDEVSAVADVLEELSSGRDRILRPIDAPVDHPGAPRYEIFHDVLAAAVLDWRRRFISYQEQETSRQRLVDQREESERQHRATRRRLRRTRVVSGVLVVLLVAAVGAGFYAWRQTRVASAAQMLSESRALLVSDPAASLDNALHAHQLQGNSETEEAVRLALGADHELFRVYPEGGFARTAAFSPDSLSFVTAGADGSAQVFDARSGQRTSRITSSRLQGGLLSAEYSSDGSMIAVTTSTAQAAVFDVSTGQLLLTVEDYSTRASATWGVLSGQSVLFTAGDGAAARAWNPRTAKTIGTYGSPTTEATRCRQATTGRRSWSLTRAGLSSMTRELRQCSRA